jgi:NitT/TauT family transport system ATP-binding protein
MLGMLEFLDAQGGGCDLFHVVAYTHVPFERVLTIVKALEMLELVETPKRSVNLTELGQSFVQASMDERKLIWRDQLLELKIFRLVRDLLELNEGHLSKEEVIEELANRLPTEDPELTFDTLVAWGRFAELFAYREDKEVLTYE